ncbi:MAG TPA: tRNA lysidine(34) synthetase TilS, partial [Ornithinibacter sp.]|nr:tRNA lysidine(34) synthetase TilS [Ornithinibacter sp.]
MSRSWGRPDPATAAVRLAVRGVFADAVPGDLVLVACSGGADSLALAAAAAHEARAAGIRVGAVVVDHGLQAGSGAVATTAAGTLRGLGLDPVEVVPAEVASTGEGVEAAARRARYAVLDAAADRLGAGTVLLGHTRDDQAEQVLLGLVRGAGSRSLAGMPAARGRYRRPLLGVTREQCRASVAAEGISWWDDPMNDDPAYARVRARQALADLERDLGRGVGAALARTADHLREDADLLDDLADRTTVTLGEGPWEVVTLAAIARPVRTRVWRR